MVFLQLHYNITLHYTTLHYNYMVFLQNSYTYHVTEVSALHINTYVSQN